MKRYFIRNALLLILFLPVFAKGDAGLTPDQLLDFLSARDAALSGVKTEYNYTVSPLKDAIAFWQDVVQVKEAATGQKIPISPVTPESFVQKFRCVLKQKGNLYVFDTSELGKKSIGDTISASDGRVHVSYNKTYERAKITNQSSFSAPLFTDFALKIPDGPPSFGNLNTNKAISLAESMKTAIASGLFELTRKENLYVVELFKSVGRNSNRFIGTRISINMEKGGAIQRIESFGAVKVDGKMKKTPPVWVLEDADFFEVIPSIWIPKKVILTECPSLPKARSRNEIVKTMQGDDAGSIENFDKEYRTYEKIKHEFTVISCEAGKDYSEAEFAVNLPKGTAVYDQLSDQAYVVGDPQEILKSELQNRNK